MLKFLLKPRGRLRVIIRDTQMKIHLRMPSYNRSRKMELKSDHFTLNVTNAKVFSFGFLTETSGPAWRNNSLKSFSIF